MVWVILIWLEFISEIVLKHVLQFESYLFHTSIQYLHVRKIIEVRKIKLNLDNSK
jgi:hypothetical protein